LSWKDNISDFLNKPLYEVPSLEPTVLIKNVAFTVNIFVQLDELSAPQKL
jgi:hypothetical protein